MMLMKFSFVPQNFFRFFFQDQDQDSTSKIIKKSSALCFKDTNQIWCRSAKFFSISKSCSRWGWGSGSWFYCGFQYQTNISYVEDTHQILFGSANSFETYYVHVESPRTYSHIDRQTDRWTNGHFFVLVLSSKIYKTWTFVKRREFFFTHGTGHRALGQVVTNFPGQIVTSCARARASVCMCVCVCVTTS